MSDEIRRSPVDDARRLAETRRIDRDRKLLDHIDALTADRSDLLAALQRVKDDRAGLAGSRDAWKARASHLVAQVDGLTVERDALRALLAEAWEWEQERHDWTPDAEGFMWERIGAAITLLDNSPSSAEPVTKGL